MVVNKKYEKARLTREGAVARSQAVNAFFAANLGQKQPKGANAISLHVPGFKVCLQCNAFFFLQTLQLVFPTERICVFADLLLFVVLQHPFTLCLAG